MWITYEGYKGMILFIYIIAIGHIISKLKGHIIEKKLLLQ
jgi:hypothetical protein